MALFNLRLLRGTCSDVRHSTETSGAIHGGRRQVHGHVQTKQLFSFRVDNKPATIKLAGVLSLKDGDEVILAGKERNGTFVAFAMHNQSSGATDSLPTLGAYVVGALLVLIGLPLSLVLIGLPFLGVGLWLIFQASRITSALGLVRG